MATSDKDVKEEIKDELKEEIKEEMKEESDDEMKKEQDATDNKSKTEKRNRDDDDGDGDRKEKKKKKGEKDDDGDEKVDLKDCPKTLIIKYSGHKSVDGTYTLQEILSKGKPAYEKHDVKKPMFLYVAKGMWKISPTLGERKSFFMEMKCVGLPTPCEPYPKLWNGFRKNKEGNKEAYTAHGMRVVDLQTVEALGSMDAPLQPPAPSVAPAGGDGAAKDAAPAGGDGAAEDAAPAPPPPPKKSHKKKQPEVVPDSKPAAKAKPGAKPEEVKKEVESEAIKALRAELEKMKPSEMKKKMKELGCSAEAIQDAGDSDSPKVAYEKAIIAQAIANEMKPQAASDEDSDSSSESDSDSDAGVAPAAPSAGAGGAAHSSSDSSSSSDSEAPQVKPSQVNSAALKASAAAKSAAFEEKLREQLKKLKARPKELKEKFEQVKAKLRMPGQKNEHTETMIQKLENEFSSCMPASKEPSNKHKIGGGGARGPATPPEGSASIKQDTKRYPDPPEKGKLKNAWGGSRDKEFGCDRIRFVDMLPPSEAPRQYLTLLKIDNFRSLGGQLWFQQPGAIVHCDECERGVSQVQGQLQGAPDKSQFAQNRFVCCECMDQHGQMG